MRTRSLFSPIDAAAPFLRRLFSRGRLPTVIAAVSVCLTPFAGGEVVVYYDFDDGEELNVPEGIAWSIKDKAGPALTNAQVHESKAQRLRPFGSGAALHIFAQHPYPRYGVVLGNGADNELAAPFKNGFRITLTFQTSTISSNQTLVGRVKHADTRSYLLSYSVQSGNSLRFSVYDPNGERSSVGLAEPEIEAGVPYKVTAVFDPKAGELTLSLKNLQTDAAGEARAGTNIGQLLTGDIPTVIGGEGEDGSGRAFFGYIDDLKIETLE